MFSNVTTRTPTNFTLKKGSIGLFFKEGERVGVLMVSDRCLEVGWKVSDRCLKGVLKVTSLSPAQFGTNFYLELEFDSGVNLTCLYFFLTLLLVEEIFPTKALMF